MLHAEHGGGNNSTFTTHVVTSSGTDTYSAIAAALGSLKGPRHGGANIKVVRMFEDMKNSINTKDEDAVAGYLTALLNREAFDKAGLIYGIGHAVYSESDPRAGLLMDCAASLAAEKGYEDDYDLYSLVAKACAGDHCEEAENVQGRQCQCGFLFRTYISDAGSAMRTVYADFCNGAHCRMERPPSGRRLRMPERSFARHTSE